MKKTGTGVAPGTLTDLNTMTVPQSCGLLVVRSSRTKKVSNVKKSRMPKPFVIRDIHKDICRIVLQLDAKTPCPEDVRRALYGAPYRDWQSDAYLIYSQMHELIERGYLAGDMGGCRVTEKGIDLINGVSV